MSTHIPVSAVSFSCGRVKSFNAFRDRVDYLCEMAAQAGGEFVLFPELFTSPLIALTPAKSAAASIRLMSERYTEKLLVFFLDLAKKRDQVIIGGTHPVLRRGSLYNIAHVALPNGRIYRQPKIHLTRIEKRTWHMSPGRRLFIFHAKHMKFGVLNCYDIEFPEAVRPVVDAGATTLFVPYSTDRRSGHLRVRYCAHARAVENHVYVVLAGTIGELQDVRQMKISYGNAAVLCPSDIEMGREGILADGDINQELVVTTRLDMPLLRRIRRYGEVTPLRDRQHPVYGRRVAHPFGAGAEE